MLYLETFDSTLTAATATIKSHLSTAMASGSAHDIRVELDVLRSFYDDLWEIEGVLQKAQQATAKQAMTTTVNGIGTEISEIFDGSIPGVEEAFNAALDNVSGTKHGLGSVMEGMRAIVIKRLNDLYDTYMAYLNADNSGASGLSTAASQGVQNSWNTSSREIGERVAVNEVATVAGHIGDVMRKIF